MRKASQVTAFYVEVLILTVGMILIVLVLTQVFALGRMQSASAEELTDAVCLAQNAAEAVASSRSPEELLQTLGEDGNCGYDESASPPVVWAAYDTQMRPDAQGAILLCVTAYADDAPVITSDVPTSVSVAEGGALDLSVTVSGTERSCCASPGKRMTQKKGSWFTARSRSRTARMSM